MMILYISMRYSGNHSTLSALFGLGKYASLKTTCQAAQSGGPPYPTTREMKVSNLP
jgi:hypothetical protein